MDFELTCFYSFRMTQFEVSDIFLFYYFLLIMMNGCYGNVSVVNLHCRTKINPYTHHRTTSNLWLDKELTMWLIIATTISGEREKMKKICCAIILETIFYIKNKRKQKIPFQKTCCEKAPDSQNIYENIWPFTQYFFSKNQSWFVKQIH